MQYLVVGNYYVAEGAAVEQPEVQVIVCRHMSTGGLGQQRINEAEKAGQLSFGSARRVRRTAVVLILLVVVAALLLAAVARNTFLASADPNGAGPVVDTIAPPKGFLVDPGGQYRPANVDPTLYSQRHASTCLSGPDEYRSPDGRTANFLSSCQHQAMCLDVAPSQQRADTCKNQAFVNMSAQCNVAFGQAGGQYDTCINVVNGHVAWAKENLLTAPLCQPVTAGVDTSRLPSNNNRYCRT